MVAGFLLASGEGLAVLIMVVAIASSSQSVIGCEQLPIDRVSLRERMLDDGLRGSLCHIRPAGHIWRR